MFMRVFWRPRKKQGHASYIHHQQHGVVWRRGVEPFSDSVHDALVLEESPKIPIFARVISVCAFMNSYTVHTMIILSACRATPVFLTLDFQFAMVTNHDARSLLNALNR